MVDTLMGEIVESHPPPTEKVDYEDLDLPGQNESSNYEQMIKKYQAEIRTMTRLQCETENLIRELHAKLESVQLQVKDYELANQVG
jgi:predicted RNase H-like nuclease (RuvC/YqgF family)